MQISKVKQTTHDKIRKAIIRIERGRPKIISPNRKMSISAVAEEAGVSDTLIHNQYPDLLTRIRGGADKDIKMQRDETRKKLKIEIQKSRELRETIRLLTEEKRQLASINATLLLELKGLKAVVENGNVTLFPK